GVHRRCPWQGWIASEKGGPVREVQRRRNIPHPAQQAGHLPHGRQAGERPRRRCGFEADDSGSVGLSGMNSAAPESSAMIERQQMAVDITCVGFGPAMGGFLTTLSRSLLNPDGTPRFESA